MQVKLLRVLQERAFEPVGSTPDQTRGCARDPGQQRRSDRIGRRAEIPPGPLLSHQRRDHPPAEPARAAGRHPAAGRTFPAAIPPRRAAARSSDSPKPPWPPCSATTGPETCASWRTRSSAPWSCAAGRRLTWKIFLNLSRQLTSARRPRIDGGRPDSPVAAMPLEARPAGSGATHHRGRPEAQRTGTARPPPPNWTSTGPRSTRKCGNTSWITGQRGDGALHFRVAGPLAGRIQ